MSHFSLGGCSSGPDAGEDHHSIEHAVSGAHSEIRESNRALRLPSEAVRSELTVSIALFLSTRAAQASIRGKKERALGDPTAIPEKLEFCAHP